MPNRECPMCGEAMTLVQRQLSDSIPGTEEVKATAVTEWTCPECEYFEEADGTDE